VIYTLGRLLAFFTMQLTCSRKRLDPMDTQWYRSPSLIILMVFGGVLLIAMAIDSRKPPHPDFDRLSNQAAPLPVSVEKMKGDPSVMNLPLDVLTERLAQKLETNPNDIPGWTLLGRSYATLGQHEKSVHAFEKALAMAPNDANLRVTYGETLISSSDGKVTPAAHKILMTAHKIDPQNPGVRYNLALADYQAGNSQKAYDTLTDLIEEAPAGAPWVEKVRDQRDKLTDERKLPASTSVSAQSGKSSEEKTDPSNRTQEVFIRSMVDRLAARMEKNPADLEGWLKLGRSYNVLGEYDKAARAYEKALALAPDNPEVRKLHQMASQLEIETKR
jgi:cytochrome c-type biogenesis protein CcmH